MPFDSNSLVEAFASWVERVEQEEQKKILQGIKGWHRCHACSCPTYTGKQDCPEVVYCEKCWRAHCSGQLSIVEYDGSLTLCSTGAASGLALCEANNDEGE